MNRLSKMATITRARPFRLRTSSRTCTQKIETPDHGAFFVVLEAKIGTAKIGPVKHRFNDPDLVNTSEIRKHGLPLFNLLENPFRVEVHVLTFKEKDALVGRRVYKLRKFPS